MIHEAFAGWPPWLVVLVVAALPVVELRGAIPLAVFVYDMSLFEAAIWSVLGNMAPIPFVLGLLPPIERWLRRSPRLTGWMDRFFAHTRRRSSKLVERFEEVGLAIFVGAPLPGTGAWTGALVAHIFGLPRGASLATIGAGVLLAAAAVTALVASGRWLWLLGA